MPSIGKGFTTHRQDAALVLAPAGSWLIAQAAELAAGLRALDTGGARRLVIAHMEQSGVNAVPIVGLLTFLIGVVFAYQGADQLRRFGAEIFTVNLVGIGILRELGVLITAIVLAGRSGSAFTAQIGAMNVNE